MIVPPIKFRLVSMITWDQTISFLWSQFLHAFGIIFNKRNYVKSRIENILNVFQVAIKCEESGSKNASWMKNLSTLQRDTKCSRGCTLKSLNSFECATIEKLCNTRWGESQSSHTQNETEPRYYTMHNFCYWEWSVPWSLGRKYFFTRTIWNRHRNNQRGHKHYIHPTNGC